MEMKDATVCVVGLGGLGGHIAEQLVRLGVGCLKCVDFDRVDVSNLNRQLFATAETLGIPKADAARKRLTAVNPDVRLDVINEALTRENARTLLARCDIVMDALDNAGTRLLVQEACASLGIPMVHGAVSDRYGQVCLVLPGGDTLRTLYRHGDQRQTVTLPYAPALVASCQTALCHRWLTTGSCPDGVWRVDLHTLETMWLAVSKGG